MTAARAPKITIKFEYLGDFAGRSDQRAYRWDCPCCETYGRHRFNRFTDRTHHKAKHPFERCLDSVAVHLWRYHR
jgi:phage terminase large subunit GpA-like protein